MTVETNLSCKCGTFFDEIEYSNHTNEEGEEWSSYEAYCKNCGREWKTTDWGECQSAEDAQEVLQDYINESND